MGESPWAYRPGERDEHLVEPREANAVTAGLPQLSPPSRPGDRSYVAVVDCVGILVGIPAFVVRPVIAESLVTTSG